MPPDVGRQLARGGLLGRDETGRHVGLAVDRVGVEVVGGGVLDVDEDRVVLGGPAPARARAVVVGPDDLVEEALAPEDLVEQQLAVVRLAVVDVEVERALARRAAGAPARAAARGRRGSRRSRRGRRTRTSSRVGVAPALEAGARSPSSSRTTRRACAALAPPGVEGRIDVDQLEGPVGEARKQRRGSRRAGSGRPRGIRSGAARVQGMRELRRSRGTAGVVMGGTPAAGPPRAVAPAAGARRRHRGRRAGALARPSRPARPCWFTPGR